MRKTILLVDCGSEYILDLEKSLKSLDCYVNKISIHELSENDFYGRGIVMGIVISGSPTLLTQVNVKPFMDKMRLIVEQNIPVFGVCFGHQLLGVYYGANVSIGEKRINEVMVEVNDSDELFEGLKYGKIEFRQWHREEIDLPDKFILIAKLSQTLVEAMKHDDFPFYGVQFHPEISGMNGLIILKNFLKLVN